MAISNFKMCPLDEVIKYKMYIPKYQRSYAWTKDELEDLWDDLDFLVKNNNEMHFYGQVVVHRNKEENKLYIIDGQQRITTSFLFIRAFLASYYDIQQKIKDKESRKARQLIRHTIEIEQLIGYDSTESSDNQKLNLVQNDIDNDFFVKIICQEFEALNKTLKSKTSKYLIRASYKFLDQHIKNLIKDEKDLTKKLEILDRYYEKLTKFFKVMYLEDDNLDEAYTIFETLNDRGIDLASTDLLKNYILANSSDVDSSYKKWNEIIINLDNADITKFIRSVWNSEHQFTRVKALYSNITKELQHSALKCNALLDQLNGTASFYHDLTDPANPTSLTDEKIIKCLKALKTMKASTWHPLLISIYRKADSSGIKTYNQDDLLAITQALENYVFRTFVICNSNPNETELFFAELATEVFTKGVSSEYIVNEINKRSATDDQFKSHFAGYSFSDNEGDKEKIRYFFRKIHKYLDGNKEISLNNGDVHIEHIMPQDASEWPEMDGDVHDEYLWRIGNLCLLSGPLNIVASNRPFNEKKDLYRQSVIKPNDELLNFDEWNRESIDRRQESLCETALKIWTK